MATHTREMVLKQMTQRQDGALEKMVAKEDALGQRDQGEPLTAEVVTPVFEAHREGAAALMDGQKMIAEAVLDGNGSGKCFQWGPLKLKGFEARDITRMLFAGVLLFFLYMEAVERGWVAPPPWERTTEQPTEEVPE